MPVASARILFVAVGLAFLWISPAGAEPQRSPSPSARKFAIPAPAPAEPATAAHNAGLLRELPFGDRDDYERARKGFIATLPEVTIETASGRIAFGLGDFGFLQQESAPPTVNPSLWRNAQLNMNHGLFEVVKDGVYQVRGFDLANMTIVEGDGGIIVIDPLSSTETSRAALDLYREHRRDWPVKAVIYTHSHHDHYSGVKGVVSEEEVARGEVEVIAPDGFLDAAISENVYAGTAMTRRASYMYGMFLPKGERGLVDAGLGKAHSSGTTSFIAPTVTITAEDDGRPMDVAGVAVEFHLVPGTEAPAEMTLYFPQLEVLDAAEIACPLLHNVLTLRGAQVRDPKKWAASLDELILRYGDRTQVLIAQHNWPRWAEGGGPENPVIRLLADQRDLYKLINDQTLNLLNKGYTPTEIAERIRLPESLDQLWYARGYYGTLSHNVKAVYQRYVGWYDGNPANLNPLPPVEAARKLMEYMGGTNSVTARARQDFENGEYRWVAQLMNQVVFAEPENAAARHLQAAALEQLGYQAESAVWRNFYLTGAQELRHGLPETEPRSSSAGADIVRAMTTPLLFDFLGVRLNAEKANGQRMVLNWTFTDTGERYALNLSNCALTFRGGKDSAGWLDARADAGFTLARTTLDAVLLGLTTFQAEVLQGRIVVTGYAQKLAALMAMLDTFDPAWPIVTP